MWFVVCGSYRPAKWNCNEGWGEGDPIDPIIIYTAWTHDVELMSFYEKECLLYPLLSIEPQQTVMMRTIKSLLIGEPYVRQPQKKLVERAADKLLIDPLRHFGLRESRCPTMSHLVFFHRSPHPANQNRSYIPQAPHSHDMRNRLTEGRFQRHLKPDRRRSLARLRSWYMALLKAYVRLTDSAPGPACPLRMKEWNIACRNA